MAALVSLKLNLIHCYESIGLIEFFFILSLVTN